MIRQLYSLEGTSEFNSTYHNVGLKFKEETREVLHMEHTFVWCRNLDTSENRSEIAGKFLNTGEGWRRSVAPIA